MVESARLQETLARVQDTMLADSQHRIIPFDRLILYQLLESKGDNQATPARGWLDIMTAYYVLPFWERAWPHNFLAKELLDTGEAVLRGTVVPKTAGLAASHNWERIDELCVEYSVERAACLVGEVVIHTLFTIAGEEPFSGRQIDKGMTDEDLDHTCSDTAQWAVQAYIAAGPPAVTKATRRLQFWKWWLSEAIPMAWKKIEVG